MRALLGKDTVLHGFALSTGRIVKWPAAEASFFVCLPALSCCSRLARTSSNNAPCVADAMQTGKARRGANLSRPEERWCFRHRFDPARRTFRP